MSEEKTVLCKDTKIKLLEARQTVLESIIIAQESQSRSAALQNKYTKLHKAVESEYPGFSLNEKLELVPLQENEENAGTSSG